jgi:RimJ/RimL family protein N-acetyltransferase
LIFGRQSTLPEIRMKTIVTTERLLIREFNDNDSEFILRLLNTPGWLQFIGDRKIKTPEAAQDYLRNVPYKSYAQFGFGLSAVCLESDNSTIGMCGLLKRDTLDAVDLGFSFLPEYEGLGYAYEAASAILTHAKNELRIERVLAIASKDNDRSVGLLKRLGFVFQKNIILANDPEELFLFEIKLA